MNERIEISRRSFLKAAGLAAGCTALGLPLVRPATAAESDFVGQRQQSVYKTDATVYKVRKSQDNPMIKKLYDHKDGFLHDGPCGHMSHHLLHTHYLDRSANIKALKSKGFDLAL